MSRRKFSNTSNKKEIFKHRWEQIVELSMFLRKHNVPQKVVKGIAKLIMVIYQVLYLIEKLHDIFEIIKKFFGF